jgi:alpha-galactosidase
MNSVLRFSLRPAIIIVALTFNSLFAIAQSIVIPIETKNNAIVLRVGDDKRLSMVYFGGRLNNPGEYVAVPKTTKLDRYDNVYNSAYTTSGTHNLLEPAIEVTHADGNKSLELQYVSHTITKISDDVSLLSVHLKDSLYNFEVTLNYQSYYAENVTEQWSVITHHEKKDVVLNKYASANLYVQADSYWLKQLPWRLGQRNAGGRSPADPWHQNTGSKLGTQGGSLPAAGIHGIAGQACYGR